MEGLILERSLGLNVLQQTGQFFISKPGDFKLVKQFKIDNNLHYLPSRLGIRLLASSGDSGHRFAKAASSNLCSFLPISSDLVGENKFQTFIKWT